MNSSENLYNNVNKTPRNGSNYNTIRPESNSYKFRNQFSNRKLLSTNHSSKYKNDLKDIIMKVITSAGTRMSISTLFKNICNFYPINFNLLNHKTLKQFILKEMNDQVTISDMGSSPTVDALQDTLYIQPRYPFYPQTLIDRNQPMMYNDYQKLTPCTSTPNSIKTMGNFNEHFNITSRMNGYCLETDNQDMTIDTSMQFQEKQQHFSEFSHFSVTSKGRHYLSSSMNSCALINRDVDFDFRTHCEPSKQETNQGFTYKVLNSPRVRNEFFPEFSENTNKLKQLGSSSCGSDSSLIFERGSIEGGSGEEPKNNETFGLYKKKIVKSKSSCKVVSNLTDYKIAESRLMERLEQ